MEKFFDMFTEDFWDFFVTLIPMHIIIVGVLLFSPPICLIVWLLHTKKIKKSGKNPCVYFHCKNGKSYCDKELLKGKHKRCLGGNCISYEVPIEIKGKKRGVSLWHIILFWIISIILILIILHSNYKKVEETSNENVNTIQLWEDSH